VTESGFPSSGIALKDLAICPGCELAFKASDLQCPGCATTTAFMLLPRKFFEVGPQESERKG
jgi:hypothetical protein